MVFDIKPLKLKWKKKFESILSEWELFVETVIKLKGKSEGKERLMETVLFESIYSNLIIKLKDIRTLLGRATASLEKQEDYLVDIYKPKLKEFEKAYLVLEKIITSTYRYEQVSEDTLVTYGIVLNLRPYT